MDAVIGVSVTPSTVGMVLVEGDSAADFEAVNLDLELFDVAGLDLSRARAARKEIVATVARAENVAADNGRRLRSIGVTWSDGADMQAAELVGDLNEAGFDNVVDVRFRQATDALANSIADMAGFATTVVCVFEPEGALALTVDRRDGVVDTARSRAIGSVRGLVGWLERLLAASGRVPDALVVVGSAVDLDADVDRLMPKLQAALGIPVFTPADGDLALARGAALVSARRGRFMFPDKADQQRSRWTSRQLAPAAMLLVGVVTFVVSLSLAISQQMSPREQAFERPTRPVVNTSGTPAAVRQLPPALPAAPPPPPQAPPAAEVAEAVPPAVDPPLADVAESPVEQALPQLPPQLPPPDAATALPPPVVIPAPPTKKPLLSRIRDRLRGEPDVPEQMVIGEPPPPAEITPIPPPGAPPAPPVDDAPAPEAPPEPPPAPEAPPAADPPPPADVPLPDPPPAEPAPVEPEPAPEAPPAP